RSRWRAVPAALPCSSEWEPRVSCGRARGRLNKMFACLYLPPLVRAGGAGGASRASGDASRGFPDSPYPPHLPYPPLVSLARDFSPRVETHGARTVTLDISGLDSLLGDAHAIGEQLRRTAADRALAVHVAIAA